MRRAAEPVTLRDQPAHTAAKHELLRHYLGAWFPIMAKYNGRIVYYDAFAGPGEYADGKPGSPLIALRTLLAHSSFDSFADTKFHFLFNEQDEACAENLERLVEELVAANQPWPANITYQISNSTFIDLTTGLLDNLDSRNRKLAPTFAFVDPVGVKATPMSVLQRLTDYPKGELLVYFAHETVLRFCGAGNIDERLTDLFGNEEYKGAAHLSGPQRSQYIHDLYKQQLREVCKFPYIQSFSMHDGRGKRLYDLYYCSRELLGLDRMKQAMWKMSPGGDFRFEDRFAGMDVIFGVVDTAPLRADLLWHFAGQAVTVEQVTDHVIAATPFASNHVKKLTLAELQRQGLISSPNQNRKNTFPNGTIIVFPDRRQHLLAP